MKNLAIHAAFLCIVAIILYYFRTYTVATVSTLAVASVITIIFGKRFFWETNLENKGWPGREAFVPVIALLITLIMQHVTVDRVVQTFLDKVDILGLILAFALLSYGIGKSGFFEYAAYYFTKRAKGNTTGLILAIFILSSLLTYITSNDIVVLVLTPIIFSIAVYGNIANPKQLFLSQFVAANTVSMGLLIGSPTNIIIADKIHIAFLPYFLLMFGPFLVSFIVSSAVVYLVTTITNKKKSRVASLGWGYQKKYSLKHISLRSVFTASMAYWLALFGFVVLLTAIATQLRTSLSWVALSGFFLGIISIIGSARMHKETARAALGDAFAKLPYSIIPFGMCFFVFAAEVASSDFVLTQVLPLVDQLLQQNSIIVGLVGVFFSGFLVNLLNDLPSAALLSEIISQTSDYGSLPYWTLVQSVLIGVNIGCYLTPIGALAGIVWFNMLRVERKRQETLKKEIEATGQFFFGNVDILTPSRLDLTLYGFIQFIIVGSVTTVINALFLTTWWELLLH